MHIHFSAHVPISFTILQHRLLVTLPPHPISSLDFQHVLFVVFPFFMHGLPCPALATGTFSSLIGSFCLSPLNHLTFELSKSCSPHLSWLVSHVISLEIKSLLLQACDFRVTFYAVLCLAIDFVQFSVCRSKYTRYNTNM